MKTTKKQISAKSRQNNGTLIILEGSLFSSSSLIFEVYGHVSSCFPVCRYPQPMGFMAMVAPPLPEGIMAQPCGALSEPTIYESMSMINLLSWRLQFSNGLWNWGSIPAAKAKAKAVPKKRLAALLAATNGILEPNIWKIGDLMEFGGRLRWICAARTSREEPSRRATREGEAEDEVKHTKLFISFVYFLLILWIILHTMIYNVCGIYMNSYYYNCIFCHYPSLFSLKWMLRCFLPPTWPGLRSRRDLFASGPLIADLPSGM